MEIKLKARVLVLTGDGVNCENETANAFELAGASSQIVHINELIGNTPMLNEYDILALPGGFSFGDELGSGKLFSLKIESKLKKELNQFISSKKPIIGICNGFQVLTKLGAFSNGSKFYGLAQNDSQQFINKWEELKINPNSNCIWTKGISSIKLPIRHGEGRFVLEESMDFNKEKFLDNQVVMTYKKNPNGSHYDIAGVCDGSGLVFGLMPHPEAAVKDSLFPGGICEGSLGLEIFKNAVNFVSQ